MIYNILSYFVKDIKDKNELAFYKQININNTIKILYKEELLFYMSYIIIHRKQIYNYKTNIKKDPYNNSFSNYKIESVKNKYVSLFYNKDNKIYGYIYNPNYIYYDYKHNKYLNKVFFTYVMEHKKLFICSIRYYNFYKYIYKWVTHFKYIGVKIFIMNKYELHYINIFFNLLCL